MTKRLYKSNTDVVFAGVIAGIAEYFDQDPTLLRLAYILISILTGLFPALIGYIIAVVIVPKKPYAHHKEHSEKKEEGKKEETKSSETNL